MPEQGQGKMWLIVCVQYLGIKVLSKVNVSTVWGVFSGLPRFHSQGASSDQQH
ncbi:MAG: hypothetical protein ABW092_20350 [Candidatus Thiodiazotropha sp.]